MKRKIIVKYSLKFLFGFSIFLVLYIVSVFALPYLRFNGNKNEIAEITCFLKSNGSHVDIIMPIETNKYDWRNVLDQNHIKYSDSTFNWVAFGWGDKNFYLNTPTWGDLTFSTAFKAAFWLGSGAIHVTYYDEVITNENCLKLDLSEQQAAELYNYIHRDFELDEFEKPKYIPTEMVYGSRDAFYESKKRYSLFHTCNSWVNDALKSINHKHCLWTALDFGVMDLLR